MADWLVAEYTPGTALDVGCGIGFLVETLRARGVDARGIDISEYAIAQVPEQLKSFCIRASVTDDLNAHYDLIACIEVLEHLPPDLANRAIENLTRHTERIVFSSTPDDYVEPTHVNVQSAAYWVRLFAVHGFFPRPSDVASVFSPQAIVFERGEPDLVAQSAAYEIQRYALTRDLHAALRQAGEVEKELRTAQGSLDDLKKASMEADAKLHEVRPSIWERIGPPVRRAVSVMPRASVASVSRTVVAGNVTRRLVRTLRPLVPISVRRYVVGRFPSVATRVSDAKNASGDVPSVESLFAERFPSLRVLPVYPGSTALKPRLTLLTDSLGPGSLFGGVGTSLILATLLADRLGASLRIVTRNERPEPSGFATVLQAHGIGWDENVEFVYSSLAADAAAIPWGTRDLALTTSWWTTWAAVRSVDPKRVVYLLQEDERLFYPAGDERLLCAEVLADPRITFVVNTTMLYQHLLDEGFTNLATGAVPFEPAFPESIYFRESRPASGRRRFFFYARPSNSRNLFTRGLEAIKEALARGILVPEEWDFQFVGKDIPSVVLPHGVVPQRAESLPWPRYAELIRRVDLGLSLVATPHPSYPPLDLAACGAVALTNRWGSKQSLSSYSANILSVDLDVGDLVDGIAQAVRLVDDDAQRVRNYGEQLLSRSWESSLESVLDRLSGEF
jgi:SAM-dependent methyltransferase